ncbi:MAG: hypothetical protein NkDv07_0289 [Candidatus Improbicoccus devescovinae]|nr:MAG: hypothetical protein NkDv07_0289 [Candidatus Improbicoccus devescovinae]
MRNKKIYQKNLAILFLVFIWICQGAIHITASSHQTKGANPITIITSLRDPVSCGLSRILGSEVGCELTTPRDPMNCCWSVPTELPGPFLPIALCQSTDEDGMDRTLVGKVACAAGYQVSEVLLAVQKTFEAAAHPSSPLQVCMSEVGPGISPSKELSLIAIPDVSKYPCVVIAKPGARRELPGSFLSRAFWFMTNNSK